MEGAEPGSSGRPNGHPRGDTDGAEHFVRCRAIGHALRTCYRPLNWDFKEIGQFFRNFLKFRSERADGGMQVPFRHRSAHWSVRQIESHYAV